jgi:hypothetical protein
MIELTHHAKGVSRFFEERLGAKLNNPQWSWGAIDPVFNRVFLRVWVDNQAEDKTGVKFEVYWKHTRSKSADNVIALCPSDHREALYGESKVKLENEMIEIIKKR